MVTSGMAGTQQGARTANEMTTIENNTATINVTITSISKLKKVQDQPLSLVTSRFTNEEVPKRQEFKMAAVTRGRLTLKTITALNSTTKTCR